MESDPTLARLEALDAFDILDTEPEPEFDDIVFLASMICQTPVALVSLVERDRQWFKATVGFEGRETPIEQSVCSHALSSPETLVIPDLSLDARTQANTLVTDGPKIRFYAGAPLVLPNGVIVGTLCVIDRAPRPSGLTGDQKHGLEALARQVVVLLESRRNSLRKDDLFLRQKKMSASLREAAYTSLVAQEAGGVGTFEVDIETGVMKVSAQFCRIFDVPVSGTYPASAFEAMIHPDDKGKSSTQATRDAGSAAKSVEYRIVTRSKGIRWISREATFVSDDDGSPVKMIGMVQDVTELKHSQAEQHIRNAELSHRMKNLFAMVQAITSQTLRKVTEKDQVQSLEGRIRALSAAHEILLRKSWAAATVQDIVVAAEESLGAEDRVLASGPEVTIGPKAALSMALLLHELGTNASKYGALSVPDGIVHLEWRTEGKGSDAIFTMCWRESGGPTPASPTSTGFGSRLIALGLLGTGGVTVRYDRSGVVAELSAPFLELQRVE